MAVRIRLGSTLAVDTGGRTLTGRDLGSRKARTLLALLTAERGRLVPTDRIVDVLWPDGPPADPAANVSTLVSRSRRLLGNGVLATTGQAYGLAEGGPWSVDLDEADELLTEAEARLAAHEPTLAAAAARRAVDLLGTSPALVEEPDGDWVRAVRREAEALRRRARHLLAGSLTGSDPVSATVVAEEAVEADPFDELAVRDLIRARVAAGNPAAALAAYEDLRRRLRHELGTDPASETSELHLAVLRESAGPEERGAPAPAVRRPVLIGREAELATLERAWAAAGSGTGALVLVEGQAGIGKSRLLQTVAAAAEHTGGLVLTTRCHPTERSLFLQPYVDALRPLLVNERAAVVAELVRDHETAWLGLVPELAGLLPAADVQRGPADLRRRRAYDAVTAALLRLSHRRPVLLTVDDLHDGGAASVDLLGYLAGRLQRSRVLLLAAARSEAGDILSRLSDRGSRLVLGPLPRSAVDALAAGAGLPTVGAEVMARTAGHTLSVVECLRAMAAGDLGVPASLVPAVLARVERLAPETCEVLEAASVLGRRLDPRDLAELVETSELSVVRRCEELTRAGLLVRSGRHYEFANDLLRECVHDSVAPALARAHHRRAADLSTARPEVMAEHAHAAGEVERAAQGWLLAGEAAMRRSAVDDATVLFERGLATTRDPVLRARLLLARSRAHEARTAYAEGLEDVDEALRLARETGERRLEMAALRARGGDLGVGLHLPSAELSAALEQALALAASLGDRPAEADCTARLTTVEASRLCLATALARAEAGLHRARAAGSEQSVILALDGVKTVAAYLGDVDRLEQVLDELLPPLRRRDSAWFLQWAVFESALVPAAAGDWQTARARVAEALEHNRRSGYLAYSTYFEAHQGWFDRLAGDLDGALRHGRAALERVSPSRHPWWYATAAGLLATTLVAAGAPAEAAAVARRGLAASGADAGAGRLRCLAPLAAATDDDERLLAATAALAAVECPPSTAWVGGADCYLLLGQAWLRRGDVASAGRCLEPLRAATARHWSPLRRQLDALVGRSDEVAQTSSASS